MKRIEQRSVDIPVCGFTELSRSVFRVIVWNLGLESPQDPQTGMSTLRCSMRFMRDGADHSLCDGFTLERFPRRQFADDDIEHGREDQAEERHSQHPEEYRCAERTAHLRSRAARQDQRNDAEDEREA